MTALSSATESARNGVETSRTRVPFFDYVQVYASERTELLRLIDEVAGRGAFIMQRELSEFESHLAAFLGVKYALGVDNATDGLFIALRAAGIGPGDEVIFSSHTMVATAAAIHFAGATPIPVECGRDHLIDPGAIDSAITARTRAVLPTQLNGRTCDMDAICATAARHNLLIIEDAAQGLGSKFKNRHAGSFGVAAAISFYPAKVLGCLGDGGALVTDDAGLYQRAAQLRDHGRGADGEIVSWGLNSRLDNIQAAILDRRLQRYHAVVSRRRALASLYQQRLGDLPELVLPPGPDAGPDHFDVYQNYEIEAHNRVELRAHLSRQGIGTLIQWGGKAVHQWSRLGFTQRLPYTDYLFTRLLMLPLNMSLKDDDVHYVSTCIRKFYGR